jgi:nucleotide-binding universal stress UspA family protein
MQQRSCAVGYKTILVHIDNSVRCPVRIEIAAKLARDHSGHLIGLYAALKPEIPGYMQADLSPSVANEVDAMARSAEEDARTMFQSRVAALGLTATEWRILDGDPARATVLQARHSDLVVLGQANPNDRQAGVRRDFPEQVILACGRPVLIAPYAGQFASVGQNVLVAWNMTREATRAVSDALPLLKRAHRVTAITVEQGARDLRDPVLPENEIWQYFARHGIDVETTQTVAEDGDIGASVLSRAADLGIDLIVMGAYGHARVREMILGGASRTILQSMTVPTLMSH